MNAEQFFPTMIVHVYNAHYASRQNPKEDTDDYIIILLLFTF